MCSPVCKIPECNVSWDRMQLAVGSWRIYRIFVHICRIFCEMRVFENVQSGAGPNPNRVPNAGHGATQYLKRFTRAGYSDRFAPWSTLAMIHTRS